MEGKIKITGVVSHESELWVEEWGETNLACLDKQINEQPDATSFDVVINSNGGSVTQGILMYLRLRELSNSGIKITTRIRGYCDSIATIIFLGGDIRPVNELFLPFIHEVQGGAFGSKSEIESYAKDMEIANNQIASIYANHLTISKEEILQKMKSETTISQSDAVAIGFATETEQLLTPQAKEKVQELTNRRRVIINKSNKQMSETKEIKFTKDEEGTLKKMLNYLGFENKKKDPIKNIVVKTADQKELDFYEREEGSPEKGDKATVDGSEANGEFVIPKGDDKSETYVFETGVLTEIKTDEGSTDEVEDLKKQLAEANAKVQELEGNATNLKAEKKSSEDKYNAINEKHTALNDKLQGMHSNFKDVEQNADPKKEVVKKKLTLTERMENLKNKKQD